MLYAVLYALSIVLVNVGFTVVPLVFLPTGEMWPPMSLAVGLVFVIRDFAQRAIGHRILLVMLVGAILSYFMASPFVALASMTAFAVSETVDWGVYTFARRPLEQRILLSSLLSTPIDSAIFLTMIGHLSVSGVVAMTASKMLGALIVWRIMKPIVWDDWRGNDKPAMWLKRLVDFAGCRIDLHKFVDSDDVDCFHTHPAYCIRFIFWGGYVEEVEGGKLQTWYPGMIGLVKPSFSHRLHALRKGPSYSLWFRGPICAKVQLRGQGWPEGAVTKSGRKP